MADGTAWYDTGWTEWALDVTSVGGAEWSIFAEVPLDAARHVVRVILSAGFGAVMALPKGTPTALAAPPMTVDLELTHQQVGAAPRTRKIYSHSGVVPATQSLSWDGDVPSAGEPPTYATIAQWGWNSGPADLARSDGSVLDPANSQYYGLQLQVQRLPFATSGKLLLTTNARLRVLYEYNL